MSMSVMAEISHLTIAQCTILQHKGSRHAGIAACFIFATVEANRNCVPYIRSRSLLDLGGRSNRLGGNPLFGFVLPNPRPDPKG
jgi:hypothetical protein